MVTLTTSIRNCLKKLCTWARPIIRGLLQLQVNVIPVFFAPVCFISVVEVCYRTQEGLARLTGMVRRVQLL